MDGHPRCVGQAGDDADSLSGACDPERRTERPRQLIWWGAGLLACVIAVPVAAAIGVLTRFAVEQYRASLLYRGTEALADPSGAGRGALEFFTVGEHAARKLLDTLPPSGAVKWFRSSL